MNNKLNIVIDSNFFNRYLNVIRKNQYKFKLQDDGLYTFMKNEKGESKLFLDWDARYVDLTVYNKRPFGIDLENGDGLEKIDNLEKLYIFVNLSIECIDRINLLEDNHKAIKSAKKLKYFLDIINFTRYIPRQYILNSYFTGTTNNINIINFTHTTVSSTVILNIDMGTISLFYDWEKNKIVFEFDVNNLDCQELINLYLEKCSNNGSNNSDGSYGSKQYQNGPNNKKTSFSLLENSKNRQKLKFVLYLDKEDSRFDTIMIHYKSIMQFLITETMNRLFDIKSEQAKNALSVLRYYISSEKYIDFLFGDIKPTKNDVAFVEEVPLDYNQRPSISHNGSIVDINYEMGIIKFSYKGEYPIIISMETGEGIHAIAHGPKIETFLDLINKITIQQSGTNNNLFKSKINRFMDIMTRSMKKIYHEETAIYSEVPMNMFNEMPKNIYNQMPQMPYNEMPKMPYGEVPQMPYGERL